VLYGVSQNALGQIKKHGFDSESHVSSSQSIIMKHIRSEQSQQTRSLAADECEENNFIASWFVVASLLQCTHRARGSSEVAILNFGYNCEG